ncbi:hypothetical protein SHY38_04320 [Bifidobacterium breve]|jgi:hypothetical protein|uniref:hypothetical protein n=1 Tax=Bifidobacterium breve TaxID=1685 RepID=UPI0029C2FFE4|nr:hypothetical protein [Bifidobacterium breve]MDX5146149.1 hypothetical protein [Bifidobacterium breve]
MVVSVWRLLFLSLFTSCFFWGLTSLCDSLLFCFFNIHVSLALSFLFSSVGFLCFFLLVFPVPLEAIAIGARAARKVQTFPDDSGKLRLES